MRLEIEHTRAINPPDIYVYTMYPIYRVNLGQHISLPRVLLDVLLDGFGRSLFHHLEKLLFVLFLLFSLGSLLLNLLDFLLDRLFVAFSIFVEADAYLVEENSENGSLVHQQKDDIVTKDPPGGIDKAEIHCSQSLSS